MKPVRTVVLNALDETIGIRTNPDFARALRENRDIRLADLQVDSLTRFEAMMLIEEALGIEIDDDEMVAQDTVNGLVAYLERLAAGAAADG